MAYIGKPPVNGFHTKQSLTGDNSTTSFALNVTVADPSSLIVSVGGVLQEPGVAYSLSGGGTNIVFSAAPSSTDTVYVHYLGTAIVQNLLDINGAEFILDADGDTSITADTDDRIDFKIANTDHISIGTSSGDTVIKAMVDAKDIKFQQYDGRTLLDINDGGYVGIANGATGSGQLRIYEDTDLGTNYTAFQVGTQSGDLTYTLPTADGSSGHALKTDGSGTLSWGAVSANTPTSADGQALGSATLEWSDLFLADGSVINFGNDQDINLTHVADTGLTTNGTIQATVFRSTIPIWENATTISANYTITSSNNAMSAGPITINSGISVTVPSGSSWAII